MHIYVCVLAPPFFFPGVVCGETGRESGCLNGCNILCGQVELEMVKHFLMHCAAYAHIREVSKAQLSYQEETEGATTTVAVRK